MHKFGVVLVGTLLGGAAAAGPAPLRAHLDLARAHFSHAQPVAGIPGHRITLTPDGGRVVVQTTVKDSADAPDIRTHLKTIAAQLAVGDVGNDAMAAMLLCHPGVKTMLAKHTAITYAFAEIPNGAELRISSRETEAVDAVHEFLTFMSSHTSEAASHQMDHAAMTNADHMDAMLSMHKEATHGCAE